MRLHLCMGITVMASQPKVMDNEPVIRERLTKVETQVESILEHFATKADLERQTRLIVMWLIATQIAIVGLILTVIGGWISSIG